MPSVCFDGHGEKKEGKEQGVIGSMNEGVGIDNRIIIEVFGESGLQRKTIWQMPRAILRAVIAA